MILQVHPAFPHTVRAFQEAADQRRELQDLDKKSKHLAMEVHQPLTRWNGEKIQPKCETQQMGGF